MRFSLSLLGGLKKLQMQVFDQPADRMGKSGEIETQVRKEKQKILKQQRKPILMRIVQDCLK